MHIIESQFTVTYLHCIAVVAPLHVVWVRGSMGRWDGALCIECVNLESESGKKKGKKKKNLALRYLLVEIFSNQMKTKPDTVVTCISRTLHMESLVMYAKRFECFDIKIWEHEIMIAAKEDLGKDPILKNKREKKNMRSIFCGINITKILEYLA